MRVRHEASRAQRLGAHAQDRLDIEGFERRVNADPISVAQAVSESDRASVREDQLDLGVRDAERFDRVLHRCGASEWSLELALATIGSEEVVELLVEAEPRGGHRRT